MDISVFGIIWVSLLALSLCKPIKYTAYMVLVSFLFQANWVLLVVGKDLNASLVTCVVFIIRVLTNRQFRLEIPNWLKFGLIYALYTLVISIVAPFIFKGLEIQNMSNIGYNFGTIDTFYVEFSGSNLTQPLSIILYALTAICMYNIRHKLEYRNISRLFKMMYWFVLIVGIVHVVGMFFNFPMSAMRELFHNEYHVIGATYFDLYLIPELRFARLMSTFYEPSYCGAFLAMSFMFFWSNNDTKNIKYLGSCAIGLLLNMSSTGFATLAVVMVVYYLVNGIRVQKKHFLYFSIGAVAILFAISTNSSIRNLLYDFTFGKAQGGSYDLRSIVNGYAYDTFINSYGIGVGVNTIESYSLFFALISQIGAVGTFLYLAFSVKIFREMKEVGKSQYSLPWCCVLCSLTASLLSCSALNFGMYWLSVMLLSLAVNRKHTRGNINETSFDVCAKIL